jgi:hypothetical protein
MLTSRFIDRWFGCLAAAVVLLVPARSFAFRTAADSPELAGAGPVAWHEGRIGFALSVDALPPGVSAEQAESALQQAISAWVAPSCSVARPVYAGRTTRSPTQKDGVNIIGWVGSWAERGFPPTAAGSTDVQYQGTAGVWRIAEADIYLSSALAWSFDGGADTKDVAAVLTHELGHALGLLHPCEPNGGDGAPTCSSQYGGETMYPLYDIGQTLLAPDDIAGLCYLYPQSSPECAACSETQLCMHGVCLESCQGNVCAAGEVCGFWGCALSGSCLRENCAGLKCETDTACFPLGHCTGGVCSRGPSSLTQGCAASADCSEGVCVEGRCAPLCSAEVECSSGACMPALESNLAGCFDESKHEFGALCARGEDCISGLCIETDGSYACTVDCSSDVECPNAWQCREVNGRDVCASRKDSASGGCSMGAPIQRKDFWYAAVVVAGGIFWGRRRKNK